MSRFSPLLRPKMIGAHVLVVVLVFTMLNLSAWQFRRLDQRKAFNAEVKRATDVKRASRPDIPNNAIVAFFDVAPHGAGTVATDNGRLVFFVKDSTAPAFDPTSIESKTIAEQLKPALQNDLLEQYIGGLENTFNVDINQKALAAVTGAEKEQ